jgi:hypothetical protein
MTMGHGHVNPNPDGHKARCGGPSLCSECAIELSNYKRPREHDLNENCWCKPDRHDFTEDGGVIHYVHHRGEQ